MNARGVLSMLSRTVLLVIVSVVALAARAEPLPDPGSLVWYSFEGIQVRVKAPPDWHSRSEVKGTTKAFFVSPQSVKEDSRYGQGVGLNLVTFDDDNPGDPLNYAKVLVLKHQEQFGESSCYWKQGTPLTWYWCQGDIEGHGKVATALYHYAVNTQTRKLYIFTLETLKEDWAESWPAIGHMVSTIEIDPAY
jgi:hypothetical protein